MSTDADTLIRSGVAQGLRLETIIDAAREQLAGQSNPAPSAPSASVDGDETNPWWDGSASGAPHQTRMQLAVPVAPLVPSASARHDPAMMPPGSASGVRAGAGRDDVDDATARVLRGGCWGYTSLGLRVCIRISDVPSGRGSIHGFRLARPYPWRSNP